MEFCQSRVRECLFPVHAAYRHQCIRKSPASLGLRKSLHLIIFDGDHQRIRRSRSGPQRSSLICFQNIPGFCFPSSFSHALLHIRHTDVPEWINPLGVQICRRKSDATVFSQYGADSPESPHPAFSLHILHSR